MNLTDSQFERCVRAAEFLEQSNESDGRDEVLRLLAEIPRDQSYGPLVNSLIRKSGLLPYMQLESANWSDRVVFEAFKVDGGNDFPVTLHREQSLILKHLLSGKSLAVSAPTSFGKSFVIDAFIAMNRPRVVVIIVPTIALSDETRRRLQKKFGAQYKIVTTAGADLTDQFILICPAERVGGYLNAISKIDLLVVDEFYKADSQFDRERSPALLRAMLRLAPKAKQRYYLAPHIENLEDNAFTEDMEFLPLDFKTVLLNVDRVFERIGKDEELKKIALLDILNSTSEHSLRYAGTHSAVKQIGGIILEGRRFESSHLLQMFASWLEEHYGYEWELPDLIRAETGVHTGRLHRFLGQIQVQLFEEPAGLRNIISTSSIVEGVNTQAKNVIIWKSKNGKSNLTDFTYRNIIGRSGRAFRHFYGNVFLLDRPPEKKEVSLQLQLNDDVLSSEPELTNLTAHISREQVARIISYKEEMRGLIGADSYDKAIASGKFQTTNAFLLRQIALSVRNQEWNGIGFLNGRNTDSWERFLYKAIQLDPAGWDAKFSIVVNFIKTLVYNWDKSIPELIAIQGGNVSVDLFFSLERSVSFKLKSILSDVNTMNMIVNANAADISPFLSRLGSAFLPQLVYDLEEYGLPRMISRKLSNAGLIDFEDATLDLHQILDGFRSVGIESIKQVVTSLTEFDSYLLRHFFEGIKSRAMLSIN
ncbi:DEAD/DEAH box helicase [Delftia acidovorans]|uniref:DEAD/DEAH box helicase n=1 Tax=Delftia acidovorans TaxID=80866 RepID=UPI00241D258A|nr:DEAD/DEAH box helicase [Delftia acidovorans]